MVGNSCNGPLLSPAQSGRKNKQPPVGEGHCRMRDDWSGGKITFAT